MEQSLPVALRSYIMLDFNSGAGSGTRRGLGPRAEPGRAAQTLIVVAADGYHQTPHYDPYSVLTYSTKAADVRMVIIEGEVVVDDGRVLTVDSPRTLARAQAYRRRLATDVAP